jgi:hypothetical protein
MPANDSTELLRLPVSLSFVVDADLYEPKLGPLSASSWHSDRDVRKISTEVGIAETFLEGLSQLAYFTLDRNKDSIYYGLLRDLGFIETNWSPKEALLTELVSGRSLRPSFERFDPLYRDLGTASQFLVFEIETIAIGNSVKFQNVNIQVNVQVGPSGESPHDKHLIDRNCLRLCLLYDAIRSSERSCLAQAHMR